MGQSKEVVLVVVIMSMVLMAGFVSSNNTDGEVEPDHHHQAANWRRSHINFGHKYPDQYSMKKMVLAGGSSEVPSEKCTGQGCDPFAQNCYDGCFCAPFGIFVGACVGSCC